MSVCFETSTALTSSVGTPSAPSDVTVTTPTTTCADEETEPSADPSVLVAKNVAKILVTNNSMVANNSTVLQKVVNPPLITVLNSTGPITVVKSLCVSSVVSNAPQFTLVNSAAPLTVTNALGKSPMITLLNAPVTVVKAVPQAVEPVKGREVAVSVPVNSGAVSLAVATSGVETPSAIHNVFVKNTCNAEAGAASPDVPQGHKLLTASTFPQSVLPNIPSPSANIKTINGQKPMQSNKVKILSNVLAAAAPGPNNLLLNKSNAQRYMPRQKLISNGSTTKYLNKTASGGNAMKPTGTMATPLKHMPEKVAHRSPYPTHKSQIKTIPPMNSFMQQKSQPTGIKTLPPQQKNIPGQVQRTGSGLRTIPPQRPPKMPNRPNYIGKHAVQAQKMKTSGHHGKMKNLKQLNAAAAAGGGYGTSHNRFCHQQNSNPVTFTQALTAEIIETLAHESGGSSMNSYGGSSKCYENPPMMMPRFDGLYGECSRDTASSCEMSPLRPVFLAAEETKPQSSSLNTLSLICHAVYLDHNYNATLPSDSPTRSPPPPVNVSPQLNGMAGASMYSPGSSGRSTVTSSSVLPAMSTLSSVSLVPSSSVHSGTTIRDDDAASDISCGSDRKRGGDTEGEETDTAPEAEAVNNDEPFDHYGDYVTRCICGFLHDDGYMIECDNCKVWQHVRCVVRNKQVPDEYLCEVCDATKPVDRQKARMLQQQWMRETQLATEAKLRKDAKIKEQINKHKDVMTDSDTSDGEHTGNNLMTKGRVGQANRRKNESAQRQMGNARQRRDSSKEGGGKKLTKRKERKMVRRKKNNLLQPKPQPKAHSDDDNNQDPWVGSQLPQLRQWIDNYEEAVTNHYSPELRARISNIRINGAHSDSSLLAQPPSDPNVNRCRVHTQPLTGLKYLVTTQCLAARTPVVELRGKYMLSTQHRNGGGAGGSLTTRQHAQRPGPFLFFYRLHRDDNTEVCVDTRTYGNSARFVRRSCRPNAELRHCIEKGVLHLYVVTLVEVEKNSELTVKHESHDLAAVGTTHIACACGNPAECGVNRSGAGGGMVPVKRNGEAMEKSITYSHRKRRGRRTNSTSADRDVVSKTKDVPPPLVSPVVEEAKKEVEIKREPAVVDDVKVKVEKEEEKLEVEEVEVKQEVARVEKEEELSSLVKEEEVKVKEEEESDQEEQEMMSVVQHTPVVTRRTSHKSDCDEKKEVSGKDDKQNKKLSREERKIEAIMKAFERMEKLQQRRQENQAKQAHRRESEPGPSKDDEKNEPKVKRRRRKGRARTVSTTSQAGRRNRVNSADSSYATSGDESSLLSPNDNLSLSARDNHRNGSGQNSPDKAAGLLLSLANGDNNNLNRAAAENCKSPPHDLLLDSNSNSAHSSPETPLSSACLLIAAAVGPLEPGFKFPKTKKGLMNEWLNKSDVHSANSISPPASLGPHVTTSSSSSDFDLNSSYYTPSKSLCLAQVSGFCESPLQSKGNAKKRWLRQAISEDQCDSPNSRPESPPNATETTAPPKKRRLPRQSLSGNNSPATTPTGMETMTMHVGGASGADCTSKNPPSQEGRVEIVYSAADGDSPTQVLESDAVLKERAAEMQQEFGARVRLPEVREAAVTQPQPPPPPVGCLLDPRLSRERAALFSNSEHLVGTVEKTLSFLGFNDSSSGSSKKQENHLPTKRKLSITEYRQRKKLNVSDKCREESVTEESNLSQSPKAISERTLSDSSETSFASSDDETSFVDIADKAPSAFNSEPTELERQRENVGLRLKKAFGLSVDDDSKKTALDVETLLNCELPPVITKTSVPLPSPSFPIPGSSEQPPLPNRVELSPTDEVTMPERSETTEDAEEAEKQPPHSSESCPAVRTTTSLFYTPDEDEEAMKTRAPVMVERRDVDEEADKYEEVEGTDYVPPFNNPLYPNDNFASYGSVIDDDVPYEGRNPSPPPEMEGSASYPMS